MRQISDLFLHRNRGIERDNSKDSQLSSNRDISNSAPGKQSKTSSATASARKLNTQKCISFKFISIRCFIFIKWWFVYKLFVHNAFDRTSYRISPVVKRSSCLHSGDFFLDFTFLSRFSVPGWLRVKLSKRWKLIMRASSGNVNNICFKCFTDDAINKKYDKMHITLVFRARLIIICMQKAEVLLLICFIRSFVREWVSSYVPLIHSENSQFTRFVLFCRIFSFRVFPQKNFSFSIQFYDNWLNVVNWKFASNSI